MEGNWFLSRGDKLALIQPATPRSESPPLRNTSLGAYHTHMQLNLRRGLFRLWIVFGTLFAIVVSVAASSSILAAFEKSSPRKDWFEKPLVPVDCPSDEYLAIDNQKPEGRCWHTLARYRVHSEEKGSDDDLAATLYEKAGIPRLDPFEAWIKVFQTAGIALGVPFVVLLLGRALMWAISGFSAVESNQPVEDEDDGEIGQEI
jgi:hypothetical protein